MRNFEAKNIVIVGSSAGAPIGGEGLNQPMTRKLLTGVIPTVSHMASLCSRLFPYSVVCCCCANAAGSAVEQLPETRGYVGIGYVFGFAASLLFRSETATLRILPCITRAQWRHDLL